MPPYLVLVAPGAQPIHRKDHKWGQPLSGECRYPMLDWGVRERESMTGGDVNCKNPTTYMDGISSFDYSQYSCGLVRVEKAQIPHVFAPASKDGRHIITIITCQIDPAVAFPTC